MRCSFCQNNQQMEEGIPFCESCWQTLEKGNIPPMDFQDYFSCDLEEKLKQVDTLLFTMPSSTFLWYLKGHLEHELGDTKKALRSLNSSLNYNERFGDPWIRLGLVYSDLHREDEAIDSYEKGLDHPLSDPTNLIEAGVTLLASGNPRLASKLLTRALDLVPQDDRALVAYGKSQVQLGELLEARRIFERSLSLYPHNEEVIRGMAQMVLKLEDLETAHEMYSRILDQHPSDFEALLAMGEINLKKGDMGQAIKYYKEVRDLDVSISWPGIIRFILSALKNRIAKNENHEAYKEDLRKEYDNIQKYVKELDSRASATYGPETLQELDGLVRAMDGQRMTVKDQLAQFEGFMNKYDKGDPFRTHLEGRISSLKECLQEGRYFDAKQVAIELSPFVNDVRTSDPRSIVRLRDSVRKRVKELDEVGIGSSDFHGKLIEAEGLEKEGRPDQALFLLRELETALEEHWQVKGKKYYEAKMREMRELLDRSREQFDVTGLTKLYESFGNLFRKGPLTIRDSYTEFLKRYEEDSASFYLKETERSLKELQYKIVIMEKDGADVSSLKTGLKRIREGQGSGIAPRKLCSLSSELLEQATELELKHKAKGIKDRMGSLERFGEQMELLGLDDELARNIDPVRKVIERSISSENFKLAEALTSELIENIERTLRRNYLEALKAAHDESRSEVEKLRSYKVQDRGWDDHLKRVSTALEDPTGERSLIEAVKDLASIQAEVQGFYTERLSGEIDKRLESCRGLVEEASSYGMDIGPEKGSLGKLVQNAGRISSFELLEDASRFEEELDSKVRMELASRTSDLVKKLKGSLESLVKSGSPQGEVMGAVSIVNRAEVLLEGRTPRDAYKYAREAEGLVKALEDSLLKARLGSGRERLRELEAMAREIGCDISTLDGDLSDLGKRDDPQTEMELMEGLLKGLTTIISDHVRTRAGSLKASLRLLARSGKGPKVEKEIKVLEGELERLTIGLGESDLKEGLSVLNRVSDSVRDMEDLARERTLLDRCEEVLAILSDIDTERATELRTKVNDLISSVRMGERELVIERIGPLKDEAYKLRSLVDSQMLEAVLSDLEELDELSREVFRTIEGKEFDREKAMISTSIAGLLERTTGLKEGTDHNKVREMTTDISRVRDTIIALENRWRARKRLLTLESIGALKQAASDPELMRSVKEAKSYYDKGDFNRFFRTWENIEAHLSRPIVRKIRKESEEDDRAMQVLIRGRGPKRTDLEVPGKGKGRSFGGIKKLAKDMGEKRRLLESGTEEISEQKGPKVAKETSGGTTDGQTEVTAPPVKIIVTPSTEGTWETGPGSGPSIPPPFEEQPLAAAPKEKDLTGIAKLIAGNRIEQLKRSESAAITGPVPAEAEGPHRENIVVIPPSKVHDDQYTCMMDEFLEIDRSPKAGSGESDAGDIRKKLELFFERMPPNLRIDEARSFYRKGVDLMGRNDGPAAIREFRLAISSAIKIGKLHADLTKALRTVRGTMDKQPSMGQEFLKVEKLYLKAEEALRKGALEECARNIKSIRDILAAHMR